MPQVDEAGFEREERGAADRARAPRAAGRGGGRLARAKLLDGVGECRNRPASASGPGGGVRGGPRVARAAAGVPAVGPGPWGGRGGRSGGGWRPGRGGRARAGPGGFEARWRRENLDRGAARPSAAWTLVTSPAAVRRDHHFGDVDVGRARWPPKGSRRPPSSAGEAVPFLVERPCIPLVARRTDGELRPPGPGPSPVTRMLVPVPTPPERLRDQRAPSAWWPRTPRPPSYTPGPRRTRG